jgi:hypothetical protein
VHSFVLFLILSFLETPPDNPYVGVVIRLSGDTLKAGMAAHLTAMFAPVDGIHITVDPPLSFSMKTNNVLRISGTPVADTSKETGYLEHTSAVMQRVIVQPGAGAGAHSVSGELLYYYCSDREGWCRKSVEPFTVTATIVEK